VRQLRDGKSAIERIVAAPVRFFRPPRGELTGAASRTAQQLGYDVLLWSVSRGPKGLGTPAEVTSSIVGRIRPGDIVGLHDGIGQGTFNPGGPEARQLRARRHVELKALPDILAGARSRGLQFVTASELVSSGRNEGS
jgi:peptidoglycan/xylan/chitin deacetylase (PgdA/CDA1 family)